MLTSHPSWGVTDSSKLGTYLECPRKFFLRHRLGLSPVPSSRHLDYGIAVHAGFARLYRAAMDGRPWGDDVLKEAADEMERTYRLTGRGPAEDMDSGSKTPGAFRAALPRYAELWGDDATRWEILAIEEAFHVTLPSGRMIAGRMDVVARRRTDGALIAVEHKTTGRVDLNWLWQWDLSHQVGTYDYALRMLYPGQLVLGVLINAVVCPRVGKLTFDRMLVMRGVDEARAWSALIERALSDIEWDDREITMNKTAPEEAFPMNPTSCNKYNGCEYINICRSCPLPDRAVKEVESGPPDGFEISWWNPLEDEE